MQRLCAALAMLLILVFIICLGVQMFQIDDGMTAFKISGLALMLAIWVAALPILKL